jgi:hypothetical protein
MKKILFLIVFINVSYSLLAQTLNYNKNRIACSADGNAQPDLEYTGTYNYADPDDWGATPAALAILAKMNLQSKLVHYSYNNFMPSPPHTTVRNYMKEGVEGSIERWNFDKNIFFDVGTQQKEAIEHLKIEIEKSTKEDPLYFINMGPSEFLYQAIKLVLKDRKEESLSHVYILSHSNYNDNHLRRPNHHTIDQVIALSGNRVKFKRIKDQNKKDNPNEGWSSNHDWSVWNWLKDHKNPDIAWLWECMKKHNEKRADISDAGMIYYLLTGDEDGNPAKFETFIGDEIVVNLDIRITYSAIKDFEISKVESFVLPYKDKQRNAMAVNAGIHKNKFAATQKVFTGPDGFYKITLITLTEEDGESTYKIRVNGKLIGEFQNPKTNKDLEEYIHSFDNIELKNGAVLQIESDSHSNKKIPEGSDFAFSRGRWRSISFEMLKK